MEYSLAFLFISMIGHAQAPASTPPAPTAPAPISKPQPATIAPGSSAAAGVNTHPVPTLTATPGTGAAAVDPAILAKGQKLCALVIACNKGKPGKAAWCLKKGLKESGLVDHLLEGQDAKDLARYLRREGYEDLEMGLSDFSQLPDGSILVLDAHDPVKDRKPFCPKVYGNVVVKCGTKWVDDQYNDLNFHMRRGCRTKGIWVQPDLAKALAPPPPPAKED